jgi:hypothetical protein
MAAPVLRTHVEIDAAFGRQVPPPFREPTRWPSRRLLAGPPVYVTDDQGTRWRVLDVVRWGHLVHAARPLYLAHWRITELVLRFLDPPHPRATERWFPTADRQLRVASFPARDVGERTLRRELGGAQALRVDLWGQPIRPRCGSGREAVRRSVERNA